MIKMNGALWKKLKRNEIDFITNTQRKLIHEIYWHRAEYILSTFVSWSLEVSYDQMSHVSLKCLHYAVAQAWPHLEGDQVLVHDANPHTRFRATSLVFAGNVLLN